MPKRPRQAHVPQQATRRRRPRKSGPTISEDQLYAPPSPAVGAPGVTGDVIARPLPSATPRAAAPVRLQTALPVYDRSFILAEVRRIAAVSSALLLTLIVLTILLR